MVDGAIRYYSEGTDMIKTQPQLFREAIQQQIIEQDVIGQYISERVTQTNNFREDRVTPNELHNDFLKWYKKNQNSEHVKMRKRDLKHALIKKGFVSTKYRGIHYWRGIMIPLPEPKPQQHVF